MVWRCHKCMRKNHNKLEDNTKVIVCPRCGAKRRYNPQVKGKPKSTCSHCSNRLYTQESIEEGVCLVCRQVPFCSACSKRIMGNVQHIGHLEYDFCKVCILNREAHRFIDFVEAKKRVKVDNNECSTKSNE